MLRFVALSVSGDAMNGVVSLRALLISASQVQCGVEGDLAGKA